MEAATWTVPAHRMKADSEHRVPLSSAALDVLKKAKDEQGKRRKRVHSPLDMIFPDRDGREMMSENAMRQLLVNKFVATVHGLRSTFMDWAVEQTLIPAEIAEHALAHLEGSETVKGLSADRLLRETPGVDGRLGRFS